jgi:hypothetical protein
LQTATVRMEVRSQEGLLLWGLVGAPTCRLDLRFTLTGRTGINLSLPVTHFPKMVSGPSSPPAPRLLTARSPSVRHLGEEAEG